MVSVSTPQFCCSARAPHLLAVSPGAEAALNASAEEADFGLAVAELRRLPEFRRARRVRVHFRRRDLEVRLAVLRAGKTLLVPRRGLGGLVALDPAKIDPGSYAEAAAEAPARAAERAPWGPAGGRADQSACTGDGFRGASRVASGRADPRRLCGRPYTDIDHPCSDSLLSLPEMTQLAAG